MQSEQYHNKYNYIIEEEIFPDDDGNNCTCYAVLVIFKDKVIKRYESVFFNKDYAECFVETCNRLSLDAIHIADVIEDAISDCY